VYREGFPFVLLWAQKAGCTFLVNWYFWHLGLLEEANAYLQEEHGLSVHRYENEVFKAQEGYLDVLAAAIGAAVPMVNFLRCPYARVFSSYMEVNNRFFIELEDAGRCPPAMNIRKHILRETYGDDVPLDYPVGLGDYLAWLAEQSLATLDKHHCPQSGELYALPGIRHYRLEEAPRAIAQLEAEFGLRPSAGSQAEFASTHHHRKLELAPEATLALLRRGIPLTRSKYVPIPAISRQLLENSEFGELIEQIFREDIRLYDSID
jgi:hypothetical protein